MKLTATFFAYQSAFHPFFFSSYSFNLSFSRWLTRRVSRILFDDEEVVEDGRRPSNKKRADVTNWLVKLKWSPSPSESAQYSFSLSSNLLAVQKPLLISQHFGAKLLGKVDNLSHNLYRSLVGRACIQNRTWKTFDVVKCMKIRCFARQGQLHCLWLDSFTFTSSNELSDNLVQSQVIDALTKTKTMTKRSIAQLNIKKITYFSTKARANTSSPTNESSTLLFENLPLTQTTPS